MSPLHLGFKRQLRAGDMGRINNRAAAIVSRAPTFSKPMER